MKCQKLFSRKNKKIFNMSSAEFFTCIPEFLASVGYLCNQILLRILENQLEVSYRCYRNRVKGYLK